MISDKDLEKFKEYGSLQIALKIPPSTGAGKPYFITHNETLSDLATDLLATRKELAELRTKLREAEEELDNLSDQLDGG